MLLTSFRIQGFRCFEDLQLEGLGDVNLIVGKNSVGKTTLLDALWVYASRGSETLLRDLCSGRDELLPDQRQSYKSELSPDWRSLFFARPDRPKDNHAQLAGVELGKDHVVRIKIERSAAGDPWGIATKWDGSLVTNFAIPMPIEYVRTVRSESFDLAVLWSSVAASTVESEVVDALRVINPGVSEVRFVPGVAGREWKPIVQLDGRVVPLRSLGDGAMRLFAISMAIAATQDGIVLIDEFENGLHWSVQPTIWTAIIDQAKRQNVQLFVTTHSSDTVAAFSDAVIAREDVAGALFRLEQTEGGIRAVKLDEETLKVFRERDWEAR